MEAFQFYIFQVTITDNSRVGSLVQIQRAVAPAVRQSLEEENFHLFDTEIGCHVLMVNGSRVFTISKEIATALKEESSQSDSFLEKLGLAAPQSITDEPLAEAPVRSLSLAIAQKCNLGCSYCYAEAGGFGGKEKDMSPEAARASVELLFSETVAGDRVNLSFLGGEPLTNRKLLRACVEQATALAEEKSVRIGFSITTNGTLVRPDDGEFFERHSFAVTVSLDGVGDVHDRQRSFKGGRGSYNRVLSNIRPLLAMQRQMQVSARVTVTPDNLFLRETLDEFLSLGFHSVGFSPMLSSPTGVGEMGAAELESMLEQMICCGRSFERAVIRGERYPFLNMMNAMREIHRGTHRPYPCGAGAGYLGVSADGGLYACHRFVEDPVAVMGDVRSGVDRFRQRRWLADRHVHRQEPCRTCWARYLCSGGCHHEVINRGRTACNYIRGWLNYCLQAYIRLLEQRPHYFSE